MGTSISIGASSIWMIVIFSNDPASHLERLEVVLQKLEEAGLKLKPSKCELFQWQLAYLGHVISAQGVATDEGKIEAIKNWPTPPNITEVGSFLGFMGYYHRFIPLHELTSAKMQARGRLPLGGTAGVNRPLMI